MSESRYYKISFWYGETTEVFGAFVTMTNPANVTETYTLHGSNRHGELITRPLWKQTWEKGIAGDLDKLILEGDLLKADDGRLYEIVSKRS